MKMNFDQMELTLPGKRPCLTAPQRLRRRQRAQWWFGHMRRVVATTLEWEPEQGDRPQQICLSLGKRA